MRSFRKKRNLSNVILFSIGEFAWLVVFFMLIVSNKLSDDLKDAVQESEEYRQKIAVIESHLNEQDKGQEVETSYQSQISRLTEQLNKYDQVNTDLESARSKLRLLESLEEELRAAKIENKKIASLKKTIADQGREIDRFEQQAEELTERQAELAAKDVELKQMAQSLSNELSLLQEKEMAIRQEIVGISEESLRKVVFIFDRSSSMAEADGRWEAAQREVRIWLEFMPILEIALIDFHSNVNIFPEQSGDYLRLRKKDKTIVKANLTELLRKFSLSNLEGGTNTYLALEKAYEYSDATMIILFTDGKPNILDGRKVNSSKIMDQITEMVTSKRIDGQNKPIYSVAIGSYGEDQVSFLKGLAQITEGNFIGK